MRVFPYGTLLNPAVLATCGGHVVSPRRITQASLPGWRRVAMRDLRWPTLRRDPRGQVTGAVAILPAAFVARLAAYEGPAYCLVRVVVVTPSGKTVANTWIAPGGTRRPWRE